MTNSMRFSLAAALCLAVTSGAASAQDRGPSGVRVGGLLGGGGVVNREDGVSNPQGFGLGVQGGYTFDMGLYVGGTLLWFVGDKEDNLLFEGRFNNLQFSGDLGYDFELVDNLVLRPIVGLGVNRNKLRITAPTDDTEADAGFMLAPGVELLFDVTDMIYVGGLFRMPISFMGDNSLNNDSDVDFSVQGFVTGGVHF